MNGIGSAPSCNPVIFGGGVPGLDPARALMPVARRSRNLASTAIILLAIELEGYLSPATARRRSKTM